MFYVELFRRLEETEVRYLVADIIAMKTGTGRAKDQDDSAMLKRLGELGGTHKRS